MSQDGLIEVSNDGEKVLIRIGARQMFAAKLPPDIARGLAAAIEKEANDIEKKNLPPGYERVKKLDAVASDKCQINFEE